MTVMHCVVGYDPETEVEKFSLRIPPERFASVSRVVELNKDDPEGTYSYELNYAQVRDIVGMVSPSRDVPHPGLAFFLEAFANGSAREDEHA
ncbi:MAG: hypothetical protein ACM3JD_08940 [Rudaea sp.]